MIPPEAACEAERVQVEVEGSVVPTTWVKTACVMVKPFVSWRTSVQPLGAVTRGAPRAAMAITSTSPGCAPDGLGIDRVVAVTFAAKLVPRTVMAGAVSLGVVTVAAALAAELLP